MAHLRFTLPNCSRHLRCFYTLRDLVQLYISWLKIKNHIPNLRYLRHVLDISDLKNDVPNQFIQNCPKPFKVGASKMATTVQ